MNAVTPMLDTEPGFSHAKIRSIIFGIMLAMLLASLDQTIVATVLPTIGAELGDFANLSWVVTAYLLASTAVTPLYGKLSDIHGRGVVMTAAVVLFTLGSIACALAPGMLTLVLARGFQGLGGGGLIAVAQTIVADVVPPRQRGHYQAMIAGVFATSSIAGPVLGGLIAQHLHWSVIFWINLPLGAGALFMIRRIMNSLPRHERAHRLDLPGALLLFIAATSLLVALSWGGVLYRWASLQVLSLLGLSALGSCAFVWRMRTAPEPFLPLDMLLDRVVAAGTGAAFFIYGIIIALTITTPLYFETAWHLSTAASGFALIPQMAGTVGGTLISGQAMARLRWYKLPALVFLSVSVLSLTAIAILPEIPRAVQLGLFAVIAFGMGTVLPLSTVAIQNAVPLHRLGTVTGTANFFRALGGALFVALLGAVLLGALGANGVGEAMGGLSELALHADPARVQHAFHLTFGVAAAVAFCGLVCVIVMEQRPLRASVRLDPVEAV